MISSITVPLVCQYIFITFPLSIKSTFACLFVVCLLIVYIIRNPTRLNSSKNDLNLLLVVKVKYLQMSFCQKRK